MVDDDTLETSDTLAETGAPKSSSRVLSAIKKAEEAFREYQDFCTLIDRIYSRSRGLADDWADPEYDLFWASMEILKPAIYAKAPQPSVAPMFSDRRPLQNTTAELLERVATSVFDRGGINEVMLEVRDDLAFTNRGEIWTTYETDEDGGGQRICIEHLDRTDFLHEPARKWSEVGWVARRAWMTKAEMRKRFRKYSKDAYQGAFTKIRRDDKENGAADDSKKAGVWEVWHKRDKKAYWVTEGVDVMLDFGAPPLKLREFFPCPRPAYGTRRRRSLVPVPDYIRYQVHLDKIDTLTSRIYLLLEKIKLKGLVPAGGDIGNAIEQALKSDDDHLLIPVPSAAMMTSTGTFVQWMPLEEIANAIQGLITARGQLFEDFYQLSGISDIMRGATDAQETLGAQQMKTQYGSVRVSDKIDELQRIAADVSQIVAEIASDKFSQKTLLEMSQMEIPTKADIEKKIAQIEKAAGDELKQLTAQTKAQIDQAKAQPQQPQQQGQAPQQQQPDPGKIQQAFEQGKQAIIAKYGPQLQKLTEAVPIEDVVDLLRNDRARGFAFEIATDSTVMTDEAQEKASRNELLSVFTNATQSVQTLATLGEQGAALAGGLLKFVLAPYRVGRTLDSLVDEFIDAAPELAKQLQEQNGQGGGDDKAIAEANQKIAEAELIKAQAATTKVQTDANGKMQDMQLKAAQAEADHQNEQHKMQIEIGKLQSQIKLNEAQVDKIYAEIKKMGMDASNQSRQQDREDIKTVSDIHARQTDQAMSAQDRQQQAVESERSAAMGERQQAFSERSGDRQLSIAEKAAMAKGKTDA